MAYSQRLLQYSTLADTGHSGRGWLAQEDAAVQGRAINHRSSQNSMPGTVVIGISRIRTS